MFESYSVSKDLYKIMEMTKRNLIPFRSVISLQKSILTNQQNPFSRNISSRIAAASLEVMERITREYEKPEFGIKHTIIKGKMVDIKQEIAASKPFCHLQHFKKPSDIKQPKLLIVAPLAGHHSTLLRNTVETLLPDFDVYITDWINASLVPPEEGRFDMYDYVKYLIEFFKNIGENAHVMAVCQPTVPVLAAVSMMSEDNNKYLPRSMVLIGGPIDARKNPTVVNDFAQHKSIEWFEKNLITQVPPHYPGHGRLVYPGFIQLAGFLSMNPRKHIESHIELFKNLLADNDEEADKTKDFYDEYLSFMDLPAEFYLETIQKVFLDFSLATGKLMFEDRKIQLSSITKTALLGIEGEKDDIAGVGQTKASLELCKNIPDDRKHYHLQPGVGHYGVFSGSKFKQFVAPVIKDFILKYSV